MIHITAVRTMDSMHLSWDLYTIICSWFLYIILTLDGHTPRRREAQIPFVDFYLARIQYTLLGYIVTYHCLLSRRTKLLLIL